MREGGVAISAETIGGGSIQISSFMTFYISHPIRKHSRKDVFAMTAKQLQYHGLFNLNSKKYFSISFLNEFKENSILNCPGKTFC